MASPRTTPPFRAGHVGSFPRLQRLLEARGRLLAGCVSSWRVA